MDIQQRFANEKNTYLSAIREKANGRRIFIYGAGAYGRGIATLLKKEGIHVDGFVVTQMTYNQEIIYKLPVRAFSELLTAEDNILVLVGAKEQFQADIVKMLRKSGMENYLLPPVHISEIMNDLLTRHAMEITPKAGCSIHCKYCPQDLFLQQYFSKNRQIEMTFEEFREYLGKMPQDTVIDFAGFVEPFLAKDGVKMVRYAHETGHEVRLFTTLVGLDLASFQKIEDIPFSLVVLHLPDVHGYAHIPVTDEYLELLRYVVAKRRINGEPFVDTANCQAAPDPRVVEIIGHQIQISWDLIDRAGNLENAELRHGGLGKEENGNLCYCERSLPLSHNVLLPNGDVVLCCMDFGMRHILGNLKKQSYEEILQSEEMKRIRKALRKRAQDTLCEKCIALKRFCD